MDNDSGNDKGSIAIRKEPVQELREVIKSNEEHQKELAAIQHQQKFNEIMASSAHQIIKMDKMVGISTVFFKQQPNYQLFSLWCFFYRSTSCQCSYTWLIINPAPILEPAGVNDGFLKDGF